MSKNKVLVFSESLKSVHGLSDCIKLHETTRKVDMIATRGNVIAAMLVGYSESPNRVATSIHDTKSVLFKGL